MHTNGALTLGTGMLDAAKSKPSLLVAGLSASGALAFPSWSWFLVASASYAALLACGLLKHGSFRQLARELRTGPSLPDAADFVDPLARQFIYRVAHGRDETRRVMKRHAMSLAGRLANHIDRLVEVEERVVALVRRLEEMSVFLGGKSLRALETEADRFRRASEAARNERLRSEYARARVALDEEITALRDIAATRDLVVAKLETLVGTLEMFPAQAVRLAVLAAEGFDDDDDGWDDPRSFVADTREVDELLGTGWQSSRAVPGDAPGTPAC